MATDTASNKPIGTISSVTGQARIIGADGTVRPAVAGDKIFMREMVFTTANATVQIQLENGQTVNVASDSEYVVGPEGSGGAAAALDQAAQKGAVAAGGELMGAKVIGIIKDMVGEVKVTSADGSVRTAQVGDKVYAGETVASSVSGPVSIALEGGGTLQCDPGATLALTSGILALAGQKPATDIAALQAAIASGADPTQVADATAAGGAPAAGGSEDGGGGHSFILLNQANSEDFVTAGFNTYGAGISFPTFEYQLFPSGNSVPIFPPATVRVSEEGLSGGLPDAVGAQDTTDSPTAGGINNITDQQGTALSMALTAPDEVLTSDGQPIVWTGSGTNTLVGSVGESPIITITIDNLGNYNVTLSGSIDQPDLSIEDEVSFEVGVTVSDGRDSTTSSITITVEDDAPVANPDSTDVPEDAALVTYNVLANDELGSDGGTLTSAASSNPNVTINGVTPEGDITFTVARGYEGPIVIDYVVTDHDGDHQSSQLTVNVGPDSTPSVAPIVKANDTQVFESALTPDGSGGGSVSTDGSFEIDTGNDALEAFEIQGANGAWIDVTHGGSVQGAYGTLLISVVDGAYTWTYTISDNTLDHTDASTADGDGDRGVADNVFDPFQIRISDDDGDTSPEANLTIKVADDGPSLHIVADDATVVEGETVDGAWNQVAGADGGVVKVLFGGEAYDLGQAIDTGKGILTVNAGSWSFAAADDLDNDLAQSVSFALQITDGDSDVASDELTIDITDGVGPTLGEVNSVALAVDEDDLPAGSDIAKEPLADSSTLTFTAGSDAIDSIVFGATGGIVVAGLDASIAWAASGDGRVLTGSIDGLEAIRLQLSGAASVAAGASGDVTVTATLLDDFPHDQAVDSLQLSGVTVVGADDDGDATTGTVSVQVIDDAPTARDDSDAVAAGDYGPVTGNVMTDASAGDAGDADVNAADTEGADGAAVSAVSGAGGADSSFDDSGHLVVSGQYGVLTIDAAGDYSYLRNQGTPGGVTDTFTYTLTDGDGDTSTADLVISVADSGTDLDVPTIGEGGTNVAEKGLPARGSEAAGTGEIADGNGTDNDDASESTSGTIGFNAEDGPPVVTIDGVAVTGVAGQQFVHEGVGTLTITSYSYNAASGSGTIGYSYTLADNTSGDATHDDFAIVVTDQDGDDSESTLVINIADDAPIANADTDSVTEGVGITATGNVVLGGTDAGDANSTDGVADVAGADSFSGAVVGVAAGDTGATLVNSATVATAITGVYGKLTLNADGSYSYDPNEDIDNETPVQDVFTYTIHDGDGDLRSTTLTITIADGAVPVPAGEPLSLTVDDQNLADGSTAAGADFDSGLISFTAGSDALVSFAFGTDLSGLDSSLTWTRVSDTLIRGSDERGAVIELTLTGPEGGSIGVEETGTVTVTARLLDNYDTHPSFTLDDLQALGSVAVVASDQDGDSTSQTVSVSVSDDVPVIDILPAVSDAGPTTDNVFENADPIGGTWTHDYRADQDTNGDNASPAAIKILVDGIQGEFDLDDEIVVAGKGTLTVSSDGTWLFDPVTSVVGIQSVNFTVRITDVDGDVAEDSHTVRILDANSPSGAEDEADPVDEDGFQPAGIPGGDGDDPGVDTTSVSDFLTYSYGEDGAAAVDPFVWNTTGLAAMNLVTSADQSPVSYAVVGGTTLVAFTAAGSAEEPDVFILTLDPVTKAYEFTLLQPLEHDNEQGSPGFEDNIDFRFNYTIKDEDGSTDTGYLDVTVDDDTPEIVGTNATALLDDEGATTVYATANAGGTDDQSPNTVSTGGTLLHSYGADGAGTVLLTGATLPAAGGFSYAVGTDGLTLTIKQVQNSVTVDVLQVTLSNATGGSYTVTQLKPIFHPNAGVSEENLPFTIAYQVTDGDGDTVNGSLSISVDDDTPVANGASDVTTFNADDFLVDGDLNVSIGADGLGSYQFSGFTDGTQGKVGLLNDKDMTSNGAPVYLFGVGTNVLTGSTDSDNSDASARVFTVTLNSDGSYTLEMMGSLDSLTDFNLVDLGTLGISGGNGAYFVVGAGTTGTFGDDVLITAAQPNGTVNTASDDIGTGNQWVVERTGLRFDFVNNLQLNGTFSDHRTLTGVTVGLADVSPTGGGDSEADVIIGLFKNSTNTLPSGTNIFAELAASSAGSIDDSEQADINTFKSLVTSIRYFTNGGGVGTPVEVVLKTPAEIQQAFDDGRIELVHGYNTTYHQGGTTLQDSISGLVVHDVYANTSVGLTTTVGFDAVEIFNYDGYKFSINSISGAYLSTEKVVFNADFVAIDGDGDKTPDSFTMTVNPVVEGDGTANVLNGGSSDDLITGLGGNDILNGNAGNDILTGGPGNDTLTGGAGHDTFKYDTQSEGTDQIMDFNVDSPMTPGGSGDVLDISAVLDFGGTWGGGDLSTAVASGYVSFTNNGGKVQINVDMNGGGDGLTAVAVLQNVAFPGGLDPTSTLVTLLSDNIKLDT